MKIIEDKPLRPNPDVVYREEEDGAFLFHPETGELKCLNSMGNILWRFCDGRQTSVRLEDKIASAYPSVPRGKLHTDLTAFLEELLEIGYLGYDV